MQAKQTEQRGRKHLSQRITRIVIRNCSWFQNNLNDFQYSNFVKPHRHLSEILTVVMKCLSCGLVHCLNLSYFRQMSHHESTLTHPTQPNNMSGKSSHNKDCTATTSSLHTLLLMLCIWYFSGEARLRDHCDCICCLLELGPYAYLPLWCYHCTWCWFDTYCKNITHHTCEIFNMKLILIWTFLSKLLN